MRAHWSFVGTGETKYGTANKKNKLLPRAYIMSHFSKHVTGSTRLSTNRDMTSGSEAATEYSAYIKGDSLIVMAIDTTGTAYDLKLRLPYEVERGTHLISTGNETTSLCQETAIDISVPTKEVIVEMPARSLNTYIFMINQGTAIEDVRQNTDNGGSKSYYDLQGRQMDRPRGVFVERSTDGRTRKVLKKH